VIAETHDSLGALIFVGCVRSKPEHGPQLRQTQRKWILGWVVPCEIVCEMHVAQLLQTLFFANCRTHQLLCCGVAIFKASGI
jgi:hypothetical protein